MKQNTPDNPAAFPRPDSDSYDATTGMSLWHWFAGQALASTCANLDVGQSEMDVADVAEYACKCADAMLLEHTKRFGGEV